MFNVDTAEPFLMTALPRFRNVSARERRRLERDKWARKAVVALAMEDFEVKVNTKELSFGEEEESFLIRFLEFLIENQDQIIAFIQAIMTLFMNDNDGETS